MTLLHSRTAKILKEEPQNEHSNQRFRQKPPQASRSRSVFWRTIPSKFHILSYGATIQQLLVPDRKGNKVDVVLGYPTVQDYELNTCFLGAVVGRYANRIGGSKFTLYEEDTMLPRTRAKTACTAACTALIRPCLTWALRGTIPWF